MPVTHILVLDAARERHAASLAGWGRAVEVLVELPVIRALHPAALQLNTKKRGDRLNIT